MLVYFPFVSQKEQINIQKHEPRLGMYSKNVITFQAHKGEQKITF